MIVNPNVDDYTKPLITENIPKQATTCWKPKCNKSKLGNRFLRLACQRVIRSSSPSSVLSLPGGFTRGWELVHLRLNSSPQFCLHNRLNTGMLVPLKTYTKFAFLCEELIPILSSAWHLVWHTTPRTRQYVVIYFFTDVRRFRYLCHNIYNDRNLLQ